MAQNQALYNIVVEIHSNQCDCHRRIDVEGVEEEYLPNFIPQGMSLEEAFSQGWEEVHQEEDAYWRYIYSIEEYEEPGPWDWVNFESWGCPRNLPEILEDFRDVGLVSTFPGDKPWEQVGLDVHYQWNGADENHVGLHLIDIDHYTGRYLSYSFDLYVHLYKDGRMHFRLRVGDIHYYASSIEGAVKLYWEHFPA